MAKGKRKAWWFRQGIVEETSSLKKTKSSSSSSDEGNFGLEIYNLHFACKYVSHLLKTIDIFYLMHIRQRKRRQGQERFRRWERRRQGQELEAPLLLLC